MASTDPAASASSAASTTESSASTATPITAPRIGFIDPANDPSLELIYSCKRCRQALFRPDQLSDHEAGVHRFSSHRFQKDVAAHDGNYNAVIKKPCTSFFLSDALQWMKSASEDVEGKLCCPKCSARVGTLKWPGSQCSCGTWVTPAIQINKKAVDDRYVPKQ
jgi:hypothetical protein